MEVAEGKGPGSGDAAENGQQEPVITQQKCNVWLKKG